MKPFKPEFDIIEVTAFKFAMFWYETGRSQGMTSKHKTPRQFALHNFQKFIPQALTHLMEMFSRNDIAENIKETVYLAIMERNNDSDLKTLMPIDTLPDIDIKKLLDMTPEAPIVINSKPTKKTVIHL